MAAGGEVHDVFDVFANIVISTVADVATLTVAVVSLVIASAALRTARNANQIALQTRADEQRRERFALVPDFHL
jgi:uncharacterized membrane protein